MQDNEILLEAKNALSIEIEAMTQLSNNLGKSFIEAVRLIIRCSGRVIVIGMGKSGLVGRKISSTLASTGTPSFFIHPAEGLHGDLGILMQNDVVILIPSSGETEEITNIIPPLKKMGNSIIGMTGKMNSTLARYSDVVLDISVKKEACPLNVAPTASTTVTMALGDALAVVLLKMRGFNKEDFARLHPGGSLGKKLFLKVDEVMHFGHSHPVISVNSKVKDAILTITEKGLGAVNVIDENSRLIGIITDGDLRRGIEKYPDLLDKNVEEIMTRTPVTILQGKLAMEAFRLMEDRPSQLMVLPVVNETHEPVGMVRIHDLVKAGLDGLNT